jgi:beta-lactamase regulating signal transducer with metallopeptidase domain
MIATLLGGLESVFGWLLKTSWQASVLAVLVLLLQWSLRGKLNPRWHHALWLVVVLRLTLPVLPESALSLFQFAPPPPTVVTQTVTAPIFAPVIEPPPVMTSVTHPISAFTILALVWLAVALILLFLIWQVNRRFARHVANAPRITDPRLLALAEMAQRELGIRPRLRIIESRQVESPAIMGLFRPTLILPMEVRSRFNDEELRFIFLHEFAHLKRGDLFLQWLIALLQILHWFNPILWYAFRRMRIDREPATDALVLSRTGEAQKESYGQVLVKLLDHYHARHALPTLVGILEDKDQFKRRFILITKFTRSAYSWSMLGVLLIGLLAILCLTERKSSGSQGGITSFEKPDILVWIRYDKIADAFGIGAKLSRVGSISDGSKIPATGETLSVWCKDMTTTRATLVFIATKPSSPPEKGPDGKSFQPIAERRDRQVVPLDRKFSFRIFDSVEVTTAPSLQALGETGSRPSIRIGFKLAEIEEGVYQANKQTIDQAIANGDVSICNKLKGISLISTPSVSTPPGIKANVDIVREMPYPTSYNSPKLSKTPPTPAEFETKNVGVSAEITPSLSSDNPSREGEIILNGFFTITQFEGFTPSNLGKTFMPSFTTSETHFIEALHDKAIHGLWLPGIHFRQGHVWEGPPTENAPAIQTRYALFLSADLVKN